MSVNKNKALIIIKNIFILEAFKNNRRIYFSGIVLSLILPEIPGLKVEYVFHLPCMCLIMLG